jgi:hypothetical protein
MRRGRKRSAAEAVAEDVREAAVVEGTADAAAVGADVEAAAEDEVVTAAAIVAETGEIAATAGNRLLV